MNYFLILVISKLQLMFDPNAVIEEFKNMDSMCTEAKQRLTKLQESLKYVAPELIPRRFFNGWGSCDGLCNILQTYAEDNQQAAVLYQNTIIQYSNS